MNALSSHLTDECTCNSGRRAHPPAVPRRAPARRDEPTDEHEDEHEHKPKPEHKSKCSHGHHPKPSGVHQCVESPLPKDQLSRRIVDAFRSILLMNACPTVAHAPRYPVMHLHAVLSPRTSPSTSISRSPSTSPSARTATTRSRPVCTSVSSRRCPGTS